MSTFPEFLKAGSKARLFPVLTAGSKEGRTTSVVLACMGMIRELSAGLLDSIDVGFPKRSTLSAFTEVVFKGESSKNDRPDGLLVVSGRDSEWKALVESKIGKSNLSVEQVERYRKLARDNGIDCVITISNTFSTSPKLHPLTLKLSKQIRVPVYHWSWTFIRTMVDLLHSNQDITDDGRKELLHELQRFLSHESVGVEGFDRMPREWGELVKSVGAGGKVGKTSHEATVVADAWVQETRDISLMLTRILDVVVREKLPRKIANDFLNRRKAVIETLSKDNEVRATFDIPNAAAPLEVNANLAKRTIHVGMKLSAPEDRKSSKARVTWLLKQLKDDVDKSYIVRFHWPGRSDPTQCVLNDLKKGVDSWERDRKDAQVKSFEVFKLINNTGRFGQLGNFVSDLEAAVPEFYQQIGQNLSAWKKPAPRAKEPSENVDEILPNVETVDQASNSEPLDQPTEKNGDVRPTLDGFSSSSQ